MPNLERDAPDERAKSRAGAVIGHDNAIGYSETLNDRDQTIVGQLAVSDIKLN